MRARLVRIVLIVVAVEAIACATLGPPGRRLRAFVDVLSVDGILLGLAGAFLVTDPPFLAARKLLRGADAPWTLERRHRPLGWIALLLAGIIYGTAALLWAVRGGNHAIDG